MIRQSLQSRAIELCSCGMNEYCLRLGFQIDRIRIDTLPNYAIRSYACSRQNIQKKLCGATKMMNRLIQTTTTPAGFLTSSLRRHMIKRRILSLELDSPYVFHSVYSSKHQFQFVSRKMDSPLIANRQSPPKMHIDPKVLAPRLLHGETMQGFMTARFRRAKTLVETISRDHQSAGQIRLLL